MLQDRTVRKRQHHVKAVVLRFATTIERYIGVTILSEQNSIKLGFKNVVHKRYLKGEVL